jgi:DNA-binding MarR family transcriptional regulator
MDVVSESAPPERLIASLESAILLQTQHGEEWLYLQQPSSAIQAAWVALQRHGPRLREAAEERLKAEGLPTLDWYSALWSIEREGGAARPRDLGRALFLERYNITRLLDRLEAEGLVTREHCEEDARGQLVRITKEGRALRKRMWAVHGAAMAETMAGLSDTEALKLVALLNKLG